MKAVFLGGILAALLAVAPACHAKEYYVYMVGTSFRGSDDPNTPNSSTTISVGDTVTWLNPDSEFNCHTVTSGSYDTPPRKADGKFGSYDLICPGDPPYSHTFTTAGTFEYFCAPHGSMNAKIIVLGGSTGLAKGDVNGDGVVDLNDVAMALRVAGGTLLAGDASVHMSAADVAPVGAPDGHLDMQDAIVILRSVNGLGGLP